MRRWAHLLLGSGFCLELGEGLAAGFRARVLLDYSVGVAAETTASTLEDLRRAGVAVSGATPVTQ
ncbi:hypothetical protein ACFV1U_35760 [Streptomyces microflavus]|uniref:hypothetical protein n=1 Tax=Streptomyces microflavus TaxID=1919 RepID=UPI0036BAD6C8